MFYQQNSSGNYQQNSTKLTIKNKLFELKANGKEDQLNRYQWPITNKLNSYIGKNPNTFSNNIINAKKWIPKEKRLKTFGIQKQKHKQRTKTTTTTTKKRPINGKQKISFAIKAKSFMVELLEEVSAHGFVYITRLGLHTAERWIICLYKIPKCFLTCTFHRILWIIFILVSIFGVTSLGLRIWERFQTSPIVISMDRNKLVWNTSFPSLTLCPHKRLDEIKIEEYME